jgi:hypothetical protein
VFLIAFKVGLMPGKLSWNKDFYSTDLVLRSGEHQDSLKAIYYYGSGK